MRSRRHLSILAVATLAWLAAATPAHASDGVPKLLTKFQPVLVFHPGEELRPTTVESFVRDPHAKYFEPGFHEFDRDCLPSPVIAFFQQAGLPLPADVAARGPAAGRKRLGLEPAELEPVDDGSPRWVAFPGFWGELQYFNAPPPIGTQVFGTSPVGPAFHSVWREPLATLETWR